VATESGTIELKWTGDNGFEATERVRITVECCGTPPPVIPEAETSAGKPRSRLSGIS
jgi:hypothetical protein